MYGGKIKVGAHYTDEESNKSVEDGDGTFILRLIEHFLKSYKIGNTVTNFQKLGFKTNYIH